MTVRHESGPFSVVPLWVLERLVGAGQGEALKLYVALSKWTGGEDRTCHPSRRTLAEYLHVTDRTIDNYVKVLISVGALRVEHRFTEKGDNTSNDYTIVVAPPGEMDSRTGGEAGSRTGPEESFAQTRPSIEPDPDEPEKRAVADAEFELFWATYGRIGPKKVARQCWNKALKKASADEIMTGLDRWVEYWQKPGAANVKWPQGWLNEERWTCEPPVIRGNTGRPASVAEKNAEVLRKMREMTL